MGEQARDDSQRMETLGRRLFEDYENLAQQLKNAQNPLDESVKCESTPTLIMLGEIKDEVKSLGQQLKSDSITQEVSKPINTNSEQNCHVVTLSFMQAQDKFLRAVYTEL